MTKPTDTPPTDRPAPRLRIAKPMDRQPKRQPPRSLRLQARNFVENLMLDGRRQDQILQVLREAHQEGHIALVGKEMLARLMREVEALWEDVIEMARDLGRQGRDRRDWQMTCSAWTDGLRTIRAAGGLQ